MNFEGTISINSPRTKVWDLLLDIDRFAACVPGVESVTQVDDKTFDGVIQAAVGPMSGKFSFRAQIVETTPPREMVTELNGTDSVTKSTVSSSTTMTLEALSDQQTELRYVSTVDIRGRLAILGDMVMRATATLMLEEFGNRVRRELESESAEPGVG
ncbi:MAG TPA: SRPBCC domain-containing protein [Chloroflexota bacterium]|nr:SRPBCC domain-containing protein [Chloroflexota bacterium]